MSGTRIASNRNEEHDATGDVTLRSERRDAAEHRERILSCARHLFTEQDVESISMHQIAQAAGVGQGTLYRRYANKGALCLDVLEESITGLSEDIERFLAVDAAAAPPTDRLDGVIMRLMEFVERNTPFLSVVHEAYCGTKRATEFSTPFYRWVQGTVESLLADCPAMSEQPPHVVTCTSYALLAAINPDLYRYQRDHRGMSQSQIIAGLRHMYTENASAAH